MQSCGVCLLQERYMYVAGWPPPPRGNTCLCTCQSRRNLTYNALNAHAYVNICLLCYNRSVIHAFVSNTFIPLQNVKRNPVRFVYLYVAALQGMVVTSRAVGDLIPDRVHILEYALRCGVLCISLYACMVPFLEVLLTEFYHKTSIKPLPHKKNLCRMLWPSLEKAQFLLTSCVIQQLPVICNIVSFL